MNWLIKFFIRSEGKKKTFRQESLRPTMLFIVVAILLFSLFRLLFEDTSVVEYIHQGPSKEQKNKNEFIRKEKKEVQALLGTYQEEVENKKTPIFTKKVSQEKRHSPLIRYRAPQVILREQSPKDQKMIPLGSNAIGKLLTSIDTRNKGQLYKVLIPYGMSFQNKASIPKNSILFGSAHYDGKGEKIFITFTKGTTPQGKEFAIEAQALGTEDYSPGIKAETHNNPFGKLAPVLGISMISEMATILTKKKALGRYGAVVPRSGLKNALTSGIAKVTQMEADRRSEKLAQEAPYATLEAGKDLIIALTRAWGETP